MGKRAELSVLRRAVRRLSADPQLDADRDAGYYYPDFDSAAGGRALLEAWLHHDERLDDYRAKAGRLLQSVSIDNPANLDAFVSRLVA
nr:DUF2827 family protein [Burkholderia cenocepacia]